MYTFINYDILDSQYELTFLQYRLLLIFPFVHRLVMHHSVRFHPKYPTFLRERLYLKNPVYCKHYFFEAYNGRNLETLSFDSEKTLSNFESHYGQSRKWGYAYKKWM